MNKHEVFNHFSDIIDNMLCHSLFFCTYFQVPDAEEDFFGACDDPAMPENLSVRFGATRGCIVDEDYDYVVKFDVEHDVYGSACERELDLYQAAKYDHLEQYFAPCVYLGRYVKTIQFYDYDKIVRRITWCDYDWRDYEEKFMREEENFGEIQEITISIPLYAYPKAIPHRLTVASADEAEYMTKAKKIASPMRNSNLGVAMDFIRQYGEEEYLRLSDFMFEQDINDLHFANFGDIDGHYVCLDYSGYHEGYDYESESESESE